MTKGTTREYNSIVTGSELIESTNTKLYLLEFEEGPDRSPEIYTFEGSGIRPKDVRRGIESLLITNDPITNKVPKLAAFWPHVGRIWTIANPAREEQETGSNEGGLWNTESVASNTPKRIQTRNAGCNGEAIIFGREAEFWAKALSVEGYLQTFIPIGTRIDVTKPNKLARYLGLV